VHLGRLARHCGVEGAEWSVGGVKRAKLCCLHEKPGTRGDDYAFVVEGGRGRKRNRSNRVLREVCAGRKRVGEVGTSGGQCSGVKARWLGECP
jgi:hypothetical protein